MKYVAAKLWIVAGSLFAAVGAAGIFVPLLPATPFLLLAAACFDRGSRKFHDWLVGNRLLGPYIRNYRDGGGIPVRAKVSAIATLWVTIGVSAYVVDYLHVRIILVAVATSVTIYIATRKTPAD